MANKVTVEIKSKVDDTEVEFEKGNFYIVFGNKSKIGKELKVKDKEKFRITVQRIK